MLESTVKDNSTVKILENDGMVRMGYTTPAFPTVHAFPTSVVDSGKVRIGFFTPPFPAAPAK
jgi:hypothetical protein